MGSKARYAKEILPLILQGRTTQHYVEPFMGGCNTLSCVEGLRLGNDSHYFLVELFKNVSIGWVPPDTVSEDLYYKVKENPNAYSPHLVGFIGFGCSYSGKWWGGFARGNTVGGTPRNYALESKKNLLKQAKRLKGVVFSNKDYRRISIPKNAVVYCDPPYANTTNYCSSFDHEKFYGWVRDLVSENYKVFISEYCAPSDFKCIWSKEVHSSLEKDTGSKKATEKLFIHESQE